MRTKDSRTVLRGLGGSNAPRLPGGVWMQLPDLAQGKLSLEMGKAVLYAWGVEFVYLVCVVGEVALSGRWHGWFKTGALAIVVYDFYSDFQYGTLGSGV